jgi:nicotinic acid mononucleotide adenylyltransferase
MERNTNNKKNVKRPEVEKNPEKLACVPTDKLKPLQGDRKNIVLFTVGSFCPVHYNHIRMMTAAKEYLENSGKFLVVGGFLSITPDDRLVKKVGADLAIPAVHRHKMCEILASDLDWLSIETSQYTLNTNTAAAKSLVQKVIDIHYGPNRVSVMSVSGGDSFLKIKSQKTFNEGLVVVINRKVDFDIHNQIAEHPFVNFLLEKSVFILWDDNWETTEMSSTKIRNALLEGNNSVNNNTNNNNANEGDTPPLLDPRIFTYLKENNLLYKKKK